MAQNVSGELNSCAQYMATEGWDSTPEAFLQRMLGGGAVAGLWQAGLCMGDPVTLKSQCHYPAVQQCREGQDKREHPSMSYCQSWLGASPQTSKRKSLRRQWNYLEEAKGGKLEARPAASSTQPLGNRCQPFRGEELPRPGGA